MQFTATAKFLTFARAAAKSYSWQVLVKKTTSLSDALTSGTWTDASSRISALVDMPSEIEYELGEFSAPNISLEAREIAWWKANVFNASASEYIEFKVLFALGQGSEVASDTCYGFSGWVDKANVTYNELSDSVTFSVFSAQELGDRFIGENLTTQYQNTNIDGAGMVGLHLFDIPELFVRNANVASYVLKAGVHTINYDYNGGSRQVNLDGGLWVSLAADNTTYTLGNGSTTAEDTQRVQVYVRTRATMPPLPIPIAEKIIVVSAGTTLPKQWYRFISAQKMLSKIFEKIGITTVTFDTLQCNTATGGNKVSFLDIPPNNESIIGDTWAMTTDSAVLIIAVGNRIYQRTMSTGAYTLLVTLSSGERVSRLLWNGRNQEVWIFHGANTNGNGKLTRYDLATQNLDTAMTLTSTADDTWAAACELIDYEYSAGNWKYGLVYTDKNGGTSNGLFRFVDGAGTWGSNVSTIFTGSTLTPGTLIVSQFLFVMTTGRVRFKTYEGSNTWKWREIQVNGSGTWVDNGAGNTAEEFYYGSYSSGDNRIYYQPAYDYNSIHSTDVTSGGVTDNGDMLFRANFAHPQSFFSAGSPFSKTYITTYGYETQSGIDVIRMYLWSVSGTSAIVKESEWSGYCRGFGMAQIGSTIYGLDFLGRLFQYTTTMQMTLPTADFEGKTVRDALNTILQGFNLVGTVSANKTAKVYRRANDSGTPQTTGNTLSLTISDPEDITEVAPFTSAIGFVEVSNGTITVSYDGTTYDSSVLSDVRSLRISNPLIPDGMVQDLAKYFYAFFSVARNLYTFTLPNIPLFQFEPVDNCSVTFTATKIQKTGSGPLYGVTISPDCSMTVKVLI